MSCNSSFEDNQQLKAQARRWSKAYLGPENKGIRSPFDKDYLQQYNPLALNSFTLPRDDTNAPVLRPVIEGYCNNCAAPKLVKVKNLTNPYSQCEGCMSAHMAHMPAGLTPNAGGRSRYDLEYNSKYDALAKNAFTLPRAPMTTQGHMHR